ncbi:MAG TPA: hypothetical protein VKV26_05990 [Dehalococcoidia bacterium]|nr:hypothetical protein [Dehalococcoidia bacterium]
MQRVEGVGEVQADGGVLHVYAGAAPGLVGRLVEAVADGGAELRDLAVAEPTLETVYLKLTGREYRE